VPPIFIDREPDRTRPLDGSARDDTLYGSKAVRPVPTAAHARHHSQATEQHDMDLKITGTVKSILEEQSGESRNGPWRKQEFILETEGDYPKQICIVQWGDNIDKFAIREGERVTAYIDIQSREYNSRWYTDVKAWRMDRDEAGAEAGAAPPSFAGEPFPEPPSDSDSVEDDLPF
jgi:hypothetical protein